MKPHYTIIYIIILVAGCCCSLSAQPFQTPYPNELKILTDSISLISTKPIKQLDLELFYGNNRGTFTASRSFDKSGNLTKTVEFFDSVKTTRTITNDPSDQKKTTLTETIYPVSQSANIRRQNLIVWQLNVVEPKKGTTKTINRHIDSSIDSSINIRNVAGKLIYTQDANYLKRGVSSKIWYYTNGRIEKEIRVSPEKTETLNYDTTGELLSTVECHPDKNCITTMLRKKTDDETYVSFRISNTVDTIEKITTVYLIGKIKSIQRILLEDGETTTVTETYDYDYETGNITSNYMITDGDTVEEYHWLYDYPKKKVIFFYITHENDYLVNVERIDTIREGKIRTIIEYNPLRVEKRKANQHLEKLLPRFVPRHIHSADTTIGKPVYTAFTPQDENRSYFDSCYYDKKNRLIRNANYVYERDEEHKKKLFAREIRTFKYAENSNSYTFRKTSLNPENNWSSSRVYKGNLLISLDSTAMKTNFKENHTYDAAGHLLRREHRELKENKLIRGWGETYSYTTAGLVLEHRAFKFEPDGSEKTLWVIKNTWDGKLPLEQYITNGDGTTTRTFKCEYEFY